MAQLNVDVVKDLGIAFGILMAQGIAGWCTTNAEMVKPPSDGLHSLMDVAQRLAICQMTKQQGNEVRPYVQRLTIFVSIVLFDGLFDDRTLN